MKKKIELFILLLLLIAIPLGLSFFFKSSTPKPSNNATNTQTGKPQAEQPADSQTTLAFSPSIYTLASNSGSLTITIETGTNKITAAQLEISYDPTTITAVTITEGTFFNNPLVLMKNIDSKNGKIFYAIALQPTAQAKSGAGILATISFTSKLKPNQKTELKFLPKTLVTAEGVRSTVLKTTSGAIITRQ